MGKSTMDVAQFDAERIEMEKMKKRAKVASTLHEIFLVCDKDEDGILTREEFKEVCRNREMTKMFEALNLELPELEALFDVLASDSGAVDYEEFLEGALKMQCTARAIDSVQIQHQLLQIRRDLETILLNHGALSTRCRRGASRRRKALMPQESS